MAKKKAPKRIKKQVAPKNCPFCKDGTNPNFLDAQQLGKYVTERGKIMGAARTGLCSLHQRRVTTAVKRARLLAILPFVQRV